MKRVTDWSLFPGLTSLLGITNTPFRIFNKQIVMSSQNHFHPPARRDRRYFVLSLPRNLPSIPRSVRRWSFIAVLVGGSNLLTHQLFNPGVGTTGLLSSVISPEASAPLYLMDQARPLLADSKGFERKVREVSADLEIAPEWLMAVIYAESRFDPAIVNRRGSSATGLIQFMPSTAAELGVSVERLARMSATQQLDYVHRYLANVRDRYGPYRSFTDLYLGILYPKARNQDYCYTLYASPSQAYQRNLGLDEDKDGRVSVSDVDRYLKRIFPTAYALSLGSEEG